MKKAVPVSEAAAMVTQGAVVRHCFDDPSR